MTTSIPTYEIGAIDGSDLHIQYPYNATMEGFGNGIPVCDGSRFYYRPIIVGNQSLLYGPGSVTYEITKCELVTSGDIPTVESMPIDLKTRIDNYGYVHIGKSNLPTSEMTESQSIRITFISKYHYTNPSTGEAIVEESGENYFNAFRYDATLDAEMLRSIPYAAAPSNSINMG